MITSSDLQTTYPEFGILVAQDVPRFAGPVLFPLLPSKLIRSAYYLFANDQMVTAPPPLHRAPGAPFARTITKLSNDLFACEPYGLEEPVGREENQKYGSPGASAAAAARRLFNFMLLGMEQRVNTLCTGNAVPAAAVATPWTDPNSDPLGDVKAGREQIFYASAQEANVMTVSRDVYEVLKNNPQIKGMVKLSDGDARWPQLLAALFDVERFVVARGVVNQGNEGQANNLSLIWGDNVMLAHADTSADFKAPNFGRTFSFEEDLSDREVAKLNSLAKDAVALGIRLSNYEEVKIASGVIRAEQITAEKITGAILGYRLHGVLGN